MPTARISSFGSLTIWGVVLCVGTLLISSIESFAPSPSINSSPTSISRTCSTSLRSIFGDDKEEVKDGVDFQSFNPLNYQAGNNDNAYSTQISLRKVRMKEMTGELLDAVGDESMTNEILVRFKEFLLEPLDDPDSVLESDAIYTPQMSRVERYDAYRSSMDERIKNSKNGSVRSILQSMKDFVLSF
eukprot:CAMPEP_0113609946 /NCGR_PEP_ID=MMETSP0017_2-20120614/4760_1 /TAXON_ID=2856 /ORGANISM="Cylindrotheca closterium" /LENGTH=186 /DNA_ID=CAMNT_0000518793 /DNA_START=10 /DNA_END=567 /DNA_ORIENTATION=+ /assembly_acc=CAM_ASM_000147